MKVTSILFAATIYLLSYAESYAQNFNHKIVLIFDSIPTYQRNNTPFEKFETRDDRPQISIFDNFYKYDFNPASLKKDTIVFFSNEKNVAIEFRYKMTKDPIHYIITNGDTINFTFKHKIPYATSKLNSIDSILNYEHHRIVSKGGLKYNSPFDIYSNPYLGMSNVRELFLSENRVKSTWYLPSRDSLMIEYSLLNHLKTRNPGKLEIVDFILNKLRFQVNTIDFEQRRLSEAEIDEILRHEQITNAPKPYSYFFSFLEKVSDSVNVSPSRKIKFKNGSKVDYREVYDRTSKWNQINELNKKHLLFKYINQIGNNFPISDLQDYLLKFDSLYNDTLLTNRLKSEFLVFDNSKEIRNDSLLLLDYNGSKLTLRDFFKLNAGKVIFVDFWASWCAPCRRSMPASWKLRDKLSNKSIVFAYFSLDNNLKAWKTACLNEKLSHYPYNYLVANSTQSGFLKANKVSEIPRYMIFDKKGKLVYAYAPEVENSELPALLSGLADKQ